MSYSYNQSSSHSMRAGAASGGFAGGAGGYGHGADGYGQGAGGGYGQGAGGYGHCEVGGFGGGDFGHGAGGFGQIHGGFGGFGHGAGGFGGGAGFGGGLGGAGGGADQIFSGNDKAKMQNLNNRLASYLEQVKRLQDSNSELEHKIKGFYEKQRPGGSTGEKGKDYSKYITIIQEQQTAIAKANNENASNVLMIDNARLACEDFKQKYQTELALCHSVEADIKGLRGVMDELTITKSDLERDYESLNEELLSMKSNHEAEVKGSQGTAVGDVNVEMNAAPGNDLREALNNMRQQYEALAEKNRKDAEEQFKKMSDGLKKEISAGAAQEKSSKSEVSDLKKKLQALEIECQSLLAMKHSLESNLAETEGQYCLKLSKIQAQIGAIEEQLEHIRGEMECQTAEYEQLLDMKTRLETEINTYRKLLGDESGSGSNAGKGTGTGTTTGTGTGSQSSGGPTKTMRVRQVTEELVNGKVVSSNVQEKEVPY